MSATYNTALPTNMDWVRLLTGDTNTTSARLSDEEINAIIAEESTNGAIGASLKYFSAARALSALLARYGSDATNNGLVEKIVDDLELKWGASTSALDVLKCQIEYLQRRGAFLLAVKTKVLVAS